MLVWHFQQPLSWLDEHYSHVIEPTYQLYFGVFRWSTVRRLPSRIATISIVPPYIAEFFENVTQHYIRYFEPYVRKSVISVEENNIKVFENSAQKWAMFTLN